MAAEGDGEAAGLPGRFVSPSLRRLWEREGVAEPAPRLGLTLDRIVTAAIDLADREGLEGLSMSRLAQALGFTSMSLYRHVSNKSELLLFMQDAAWQPPRALDLSGAGWRTGLERWARQMRAVHHRHPWLRRLSYDGQLGTPSHLAWLDLGLRALAGTPLTSFEKGQVLLLLNGHVFADAQTAPAPWQRYPWGPAAAAHRAASYRDSLATFADPERYPALHEAVSTGMLGTPGQGLGTEDNVVFDFGLERILDGVAALVAAHAAAGGAGKRRRPRSSDE